MWVVLTATLLVGCTGAGGGRDTVPVPGTSAETLTDPPTAEPVDQQQVFDDVTATNRAAALAWSRRVVGSLVLPPGSVRLDREPRIFRRGAQVGTSPSDPGLTRTAWWSVPTSRDELSRFLLTNHPPGHVRYPGTDVGGPEDSPYLDYDGDSPDPAAFTGVTLGVEWRQGAGTTFVRARTFLLARGVRDPAAAVVPPVQRVRVSYDALGCSGVARIDFFLTGDGPVLNEVNTVPGMTEHSQVPRMFAAAGLPYADLLDELVRGAHR